MLPTVGGSYWTNFFPPVVVLGLGMAVSVAPLTTTVMSSVAENRAGIASGVNNAVARAAGLIAIAVLGIVMLHVFNHALDQRLAERNLPPSVTQSLQAQRTKLAAIAVPEDQDAATQQLIRRAIDESFVSGFRYVMAVGAALAIASAATALIFIGAARDSAKITEQL
jgi:MFS family permease